MTGIIIALSMALIIISIFVLSYISDIMKRLKLMEMANNKILHHLYDIQKKLQNKPEIPQDIATKDGSAEINKKMPEVKDHTSEAQPYFQNPIRTQPTQLPPLQPPPLRLEPEGRIIEKRAKVQKASVASKQTTSSKNTAERSKSGFAESVQEIFGKIWRWILVGEEFQPEGMTTESAVASTWMMRAFVIFIVSAVAYILKLSIEREFLGPAGRFAVGIGFGIAMLIGGVKLIRTRYRMIGEGLLGGGIFVLYLSIYAADVMYHIMPTPLAFVLMALVTITAGFLAVKLDSMLVAIFGIIGGYLTPVALTSTVLSLPGFYSYILVLSIAVLVIVLIKQWRLLNYLSFILTYGLYFFYSMENYDKSTDFIVAISFLTLLFVVQSLTVCIHNIIKKQQSSIIEAIHLILNAIVYSAGGYYLIIEAHGRPYPAFMALGLALFYMLYIFMFLRRGLKDRLLLLCLISLAAAYTAWTLPLLLEKESLTIAFALLAFVFLWLGRKVKSNFLQSLSYLVYGIVFFRLVLWDMPRHYTLNAPDAAIWSDYFKDLLDRLLTMGVSIGSLIGAFLLSKRDAKESNIIFPENDINAAIPARVTCGILFWFSVVFVFIFMNLEVNSMFRCWEPIRLPMLTLLWGSLILFFFSRMFATERAGGASNVLHTLMGLALGVTLIKLIIFDTQSWNLTLNFIYSRDYSLLDTSMRIFDFGIILAVILIIWKLISRSKTHANTKAIFGYAGLALFFLCASLEIRTLLYWKLATFMAAGISILWSIFAISFIAFGISRRIGLLRALGLALFVIVCGKITLYDLRGTEIIYRIIALLVIAITLLLGSFAYLKSNKLEVPNKKPEITK